MRSVGGWRAGSRKPLTTGRRPSRPLPVKDIKPFRYSHQGSLAYIGSEKAVADVSWWNGNLATGGRMTYLFWRSAYLSMCFSSESPALFTLCSILVY